MSMTGTYSRISCMVHQLGSMSELKQVQAMITKSGLQSHLPFTTKLIFFSALSPMGNLSHAHSLFLQTSMHSSFLCNTIIRAFAYSPYPLQSLHVYNHMQTSNVVTDHFTYNFVLKACSKAHKFVQEFGTCDEFILVSKGCEIHCTVLKLGFHQDPSIQNSLLYMYSQCGLLHVAQHLFDEISNRSLASWNIMISAYDRVKDSEAADCLLESMPQRNVVSWNTVIGRYIRLGDIEGARRVFHGMPERDVVSWNSMIAGCVSVKDYAGALELFSEMQKDEVKPTEVTFISVLGACAETGALEMGSKIHESLKRCGHKIEGYLGNALLNMYSKCGNLSSAWEVFNGMRIKPVSCWNAMIVSLAVHGYCEEALQLFSEIEHGFRTVRPNRVTFLGVLIACSHKGLVDKARWYFDHMVKKYKILPDIKHYGCMVDLLSRFGLLGEAHQMIKTAPFQNGGILWRTLLGACRTQGNVELAKVSFQQLAKLEGLTDGDYVLLSNIYAEAERWDEVERVRSEMICLHVPKQVGYSQIDVTESDKLSEQTIGLLLKLDIS
ncbi:pentatricopeptide repeat-containing protein At5g15300 [Cajanus cajan]|uniref:pentatricopeptide repeat-containing protein At5g15300 n=1 Tax=Cajanus cajan TaxID=3821 RepID=UPI0010FB5B37|nr:pentatricopeptide repeat-containing protein At5g15300 [Cajanus cajan]XP_020215062.2 pentatricopeptide repeat-containing protein At5g15300 [Cajanus cajan]XP_020215064.2 pentatricopeptide repeat-containing protein At5g15300 [Cajanus cajan]XP_020215065.2 pentatricopeptide repeat-containing protein At5g15300 [Cajanus cajan]XP_029127155.1 pentatricopeptide repeat-containing protein At5g15300 [Cajanus cajan]